MPFSFILSVGFVHAFVSILLEAFCKAAKYTIDHPVASADNHSLFELDIALYKRSRYVLGDFH